MRVVIDLEQDRHEVELRRYGATATLADLVAHTTGVTLDPEAPLHVDQTGHAAGTPLREVQLLEGTVIARQARTEDEPTPTVTISWSSIPRSCIICPRVGTVPCSSSPIFVGRDSYFFGKPSDHSVQADCHSFTPSRSVPLALIRTPPSF